MQGKFDRPAYMAKYMRQRRTRVALIRRTLGEFLKDPKALNDGRPLPVSRAYVAAVEAAQAGGFSRCETVDAITKSRAPADLAIAREIVNLCWKVPEDPAQFEDHGADDEARHIAELNRGYARDRI